MRSNKVLTSLSLSRSDITKMQPTVSPGARRASPPLDGPRQRKGQPKKKRKGGAKWWRGCHFVLSGIKYYWTHIVRSILVRNPCTQRKGTEGIFFLRLLSYWRLPPIGGRENFFPIAAYKWITLGDFHLEFRFCCRLVELFGRWAEPEQTVK
jgi:hypothetical protein